MVLKDVPAPLNARANVVLADPTPILFYPVRYGAVIQPYCSRIAELLRPTKVGEVSKASRMVLRFCAFMIQIGSGFISELWTNTKTFPNMAINSLSLFGDLFCNYDATYQT